MSYVDDPDLQFRITPVSMKVIPRGSARVLRWHGQGIGLSSHLVTQNVTPPAAFCGELWTEEAERAEVVESGEIDCRRCCRLIVKRNLRT